MQKIVLTFDELQPDDVVLLEQNMFTPVELHLVLMTLVMKTIEACLPQT